MVKVQLRTGVFEDGREIRGGIFLGPIGGAQVTTSGQVEASYRATITAELSDLALQLELNSTPLSVYRRPREASAGVSARPGRVVPVTGVGASVVPAVLRSRRD
jgi:hypothetical protein